MSLVPKPSALAHGRRIALVLMCLMALPAVTQATESGKNLYEKWCAICHSPGPMKAGLTALQLKYQDSKPADLEKRTDLSVELVKTLVRRGSGIMAPFRKTELSDTELNAIAEYLTRPH